MEKQGSVEVKRFWILGAGRFGTIAVKRISTAFPDALLTVVDNNPANDMDGRVKIIRQDGIHWLWSRLHKASPVDMIVPAIPVHVAYEWLILKVQEDYDVYPQAISESWQRQMPNPIQGKVGQIFMSHADFLCPDNCPEPKDKCTVTGKPRPKDLFRLLKMIDLDDAFPIVVRSHQILPGVGGIFPKDLMMVTDAVLKNNHRSIFIATACRCHGVGNAFGLKKK